MWSVCRPSDSNVTASTIYTLPSLFTLRTNHTLHSSKSASFRIFCSPPPPSPPPSSSSLSSTMFCVYPLTHWTTEVYRFSLYRCNRRHPARHLTDLDFADDLALVTELVEDAEDLLQSFEKAAALTGLHCNMNKTDYINTGENHRGMKSLSGVNIKRVEDFKYLG